MAYIKVDRRDMCKVRDSINSYCDEQDRHMREADSAMKEMMRYDFVGDDARALALKWEGVNDSGSVSAKHKANLKAFAEKLSQAEYLYRKAQEESYSEAGWLPKYIYW
ncbi:MAG: hypothetical protein IKN57_07220 [Parasporobacterium sp.]|nr:hypothetical protein [Parasporobacterium sp.]